MASKKCGGSRKLCCEQVLHGAVPISLADVGGRHRSWKHRIPILFLAYPRDSLLYHYSSAILQFSYLNWSSRPCLILCHVSALFTLFHYAFWACYKSFLDWRLSLDRPDGTACHRSSAITKSWSDFEAHCRLQHFGSASSLLLSPKPESCPAPVR